MFGKIIHKHPNLSLIYMKRKAEQIYNSNWLIIIATAIIHEAFWRPNALLDKLVG